MRLSWIVFTLLVALPAAAQSLEERMKSAAGAYERKDFATAIALWRPLAVAGNAEAETLLGAMYWSGEGVTRDHKEAARLYLSAAEKGYARAQNDIGFMYGFGEGVPPRNDVLAYKWLSLAVKNYTDKNQERQRQAARDLATLRGRMSAAQIADAERQIRDFKPVQ
jgi:TPR repeat protein